jgi:[ribosomal protein S18]-alanine N-acetyltransferase
MPQILYRSYKPSDLEAIVELDAACFDPPFRFSSRAMRRFVEADNAWTTIAEADGKLAGFCIVHRERAETMDVGYVITIDVEKHFRRHGIGEQMLADAEAWVRASGAVGIMLHVFVNNTGAVRFYERTGYSRIGVQRGFYGATLDAALYWKELLANVIGPDQK